ncbi:MAG: hypothetical protein ACXIUB_05610 [Wenzhouxiangella sp.]
MQAGLAVAGWTRTEGLADYGMIARFLLFIKHRMPWLWRMVDWLNAHLYSLLQRKRMAVQCDRAFEEFGLDGFKFRALVGEDIEQLESLLERQGPDRVRYFQPHGFDQSSLQFMLSNPSFLMFGVFRENLLVGYFFLRCFWNRKCFVGRLIDKPFERQGIGRVMNQIMYHIAWRSGFRCMTTVSRDNRDIMRSHEGNPHARVRQELGNGYILIEFHPLEETY